MSKFCVSCGANNPDMRDTCWRCNTPLGGNAGSQWTNSPPPVSTPPLRPPVSPRPMQSAGYKSIISRKNEWWSIVMYIFSGMLIVLFLIMSGSLSLIDKKAGNWMSSFDPSYNQYFSMAMMVDFMMFLCICSAISGAVFLSSQKRHTAVLYNVYGAIFCIWAIVHFIAMIQMSIPEELMIVMLIFIADIAIWIISAIFMFMKGNIRKVLRQYIN